MQFKWGVETHGPLLEKEVRCFCTYFTACCGQHVRLDIMTRPMYQCMRYCCDFFIELCNDMAYLVLVFLPVAVPFKSFFPKFVPVETVQFGNF